MPFSTATAIESWNVNVSSRSFWKALRPFISVWESSFITYSSRRSTSESLHETVHVEVVLVANLEDKVVRTAIARRFS